MLFRITDSDYPFGIFILILHNALIYLLHLWVRFVQHRERLNLVEAFSKTTHLGQKKNDKKTHKDRQNTTQKTKDGATCAYLLMTVAP
jgi:hypothetical protein